MIKFLFCLGLGLWSALCIAQNDSIGRRRDTADASFQVPVFSSSGGEAESSLEQQAVSSLLQSSRDVFMQFAGFQMGAAHYTARGSSSQNQLVMINGINTANPETNSSSWSSWGGLNDVSRFVETGIGNTSNRYAFSGAGGYVNIDSRASSFKKGLRVSYASTNRVFRNRFMLTYSTGMMRNGWAFTCSASGRYGNQVYIPGTYFNGSSFYVAIDRRVNYRHTLSFTGFAAPTEQGLSSYETKEADQLAGHYYNSNWGYQNGQVRNASVSKANQPTLQLSHHYTPDKNSKLITSVYYTFDKSGTSELNWNNTLNPHPDYYQYLPGYFYGQGQTAQGDRQAQLWLSDVNTRQINWDRMINLNRANLYVLPSQLGQGLVTNETRARYIVEDRVSSTHRVGWNSVYNKRFGNLFLSAGVNGTLHQSRNYKVMDDLLGASYWLDYDQFAQNLGVDAMYQQNDIEHPDKKIHQGDRFGYDYAIHIIHSEAWSQLEYSRQKLDLYAALSVSDSKTWREGFMANGKFPLASKGLSEKLNFFNGGFKSGLTYKITGRHFITVNISALTRPPATANSFISSTSRNEAVAGLSNERVFSGDINYLVKYTTFKLRATYYNTQINNQFQIRTYWNDAYNNLVNLVIKGLNENHQGLELAIEKTWLSSHSVSGALGAGRFVYSNRPLLDAWQDNNAAALFQNRMAYLKNYRVGGSPQLMTGLGYRYTAKKHWFVGVSLNYAGQIYVSLNPDRRTAEALLKFVTNESGIYSAITTQERLPGYAFVNAAGGASWRINKKHMLAVNLMINNLLNNKNHMVSGYEQLRWDASDLNRFASKYVYMPGATYMLLLNFNF